MAQPKFTVSDDLAKKFKQTVLAKRGKMEVSREGEEALKLYLEKNKDLVEASGTRGTDPILRVIGAVKTRERRNALEDLRMMDSKNS